MPRDKRESHERIVAAAKEEFLTCGFENASMRRIAANAGITASGLYKHFPSKENMFARLVQPMLDEFGELYYRKEKEEHDAIKEIGAAAAFLNEDAVYAMEFIYDHFDEFKLLVCCSQGTRYENFLHDFVEKNQKDLANALVYMRKHGYPAKEMSEEEIHMLLSAYLTAIIEPIIHGYSQEKIKSYLFRVNEFFMPGWKNLMGLS